VRILRLEKSKCRTTKMLINVRWYAMCDSFETVRARIARQTHAVALPNIALRGNDLVACYIPIDSEARYK